MGAEVEASCENTLSDLIQSSVYSEGPLTADEDGKRARQRARAHTRAAMKVLGVYEQVSFVAVRERYGPFGAIFGDNLVLLTDQAMVSTKVAFIPINALSRATRHNFSEVHSVSVEPAQNFGETSQLLLEFQGGSSEVLLLSPPGKSDEAGKLIQAHVSPG